MEREQADASDALLYVTLLTQSRSRMESVYVSLLTQFAVLTSTVRIAPDPDYACGVVARQRCKEGHV